MWAMWAALDLGQDLVPGSGLAFHEFVANSTLVLPRLTLRFPVLVLALPILL